MGNLTALLTRLQPAVYDEKSETDRNSSNPGFVEKVSIINATRTAQAIMERSPILKEMIKTGQIGIVGGSYDVANGKVMFFHDALISNSSNS